MALPYALSLGALLAHFPGAARWERLGAGAAGGGTTGPRPGGTGAGSGPRNPMVRG